MITTLKLSIILFPIKHTVLRCIKFQNSTGYKIPQDALGMSQVNSPRVEHQIPDIGTTSCHAELQPKGKIRSRRDEREKTSTIMNSIRKKNPQHNDRHFPFTEAMKLSGICIIFKNAFLQSHA